MVARCRNHPLVAAAPNHRLFPCTPKSPQVLRASIALPSNAHSIRKMLRWRYLRWPKTSSRAIATGEQPLIWVRSLDSLIVQPLEGNEGASDPFWSPDSRFIGFFADGKMKKVDSSGGGTVQTLCEDWPRCELEPEGRYRVSSRCVHRLSLGHCLGGNPVRITHQEMTRRMLTPLSARWKTGAVLFRHTYWWQDNGIYCRFIDSQRKFSLSIMQTVKVTLSNQLPGLRRDGDLMAMPWTETAQPTEKPFALQMEFVSILIDRPEIFLFPKLTLDIPVRLLCSDEVNWHGWIVRETNLKL